MTRVRKAVATLAIGLLIVAGWAAVRRHEVARAVMIGGLRLAGYQLRLDDLHLGAGGATLTGAHLERDGSQLLAAPQIDVRYNLRDLLPGSSHRFGVTAVTIDRPVVTISRDARGNFNLPSSVPTGGGPSLPAFPNRVPLRFTFAIRDGRVELRAPAAEPAGRFFRIGDLQVHGVFNSAGRTHYTLSAAFETDPKEPFEIAGTIDVPRGFAMHRARAARVPIREIADFFLSGDAANVLAGRGTNLDAHLYALDVAGDAFSGTYHSGVSIDADGVALALSVMTRPIERLSGHLDIIDDAFFMRRVDGELAGAHLSASGSIFDLSDPKMQLSVDGSGNLATLRNAFAFAKTQPIAGATSLHVALSGALANPVIAIHAGAARITYAHVPFDDLRASVVIHDNVVAFVPLLASYGGAGIAIRGALTLGSSVGSNAVAHISAPADRLPYLGELLGNEGVVGDAIVRGTDLGFHARGAFASVRGIGRTAALVEADPNGTVAVAPFRVHTERGQFDGGYDLDRPRDTSAFWGSLANFSLHAPGRQDFPGLKLPSVPAIDTHVTNAQIAGIGSGHHVAIGGTLAAGDADIAGFRLNRLNASFAGTLDGAEITALSADGPWGSFDGRGAFSTEALLARGMYRGTLEGLQPFLGGIAAHGRMAGHAAISMQNGAVFVQAQDLALQGATIHGIPLQRVNGTMAIKDGSLHVYSAHAQTAGGDVTAAGTYALSRHAGREGLAIVASGLDGGQLHGLGLPLSGGRLSTAGTLVAGAPLPSYDGTFALRDGRADQIPIAGTGIVSVGGNAVQIGRGVVALGGAYAFLHGSVNSLSSSAPAYALQAEVPAADVAGALHALSLPNYQTQGTFSADLAVSGSGLDPHVHGPVLVGGGDVNGLSFIDGRAVIDAGGGSVRATHGGVVVATTYARFAALSETQRRAFFVDAPVADLGDFNNFFDTGDTLDGNGSIAFHVNVDHDSVRTGGDVDVTGFRFRNLPIGDTDAEWSSQQSTLSGTLSVGGDHGRLNAGGTVGIVPKPTWQSTLQASRYDLSAAMSNLDLSLWVAAFGFPQIPITGRADGKARVLGRYPNLSIDGSAQVFDGTFGRLPLDRFELAGHSNGNRVEIDHGLLEAPGLQATASGSFGLQPDSAVAVRAHASSDDIPRLMSQLTHAQAPILGSVEITVDLGGVLRAPTVSGAFDATNISYRDVVVDSVFGQARLRGSTLELSNAGATLGTGQVTLAGALPLQLAPFGVGPPDKPLNFDVGIAAVNPHVVAPLLGNNTKLGGEIDGHVGLAGTVGSPRIFGNLALRDGSYVSDFQRKPVTDTVAAIVFDNQRGELTHFSSRVGGGTVDASGHIVFASAGNAVFSLQGNAHNAQFDFPAYGQGTVNGKFTLAREPQRDALLSGKATVEDATILFSAFFAAAQGAQTVAGAPRTLPLKVGLDLNLNAGRNVRVRGGGGLGAGIDIGTTGSLAVTGTLADPSLEGAFTSTGGTLTYFDRSFRMQSGKVAFHPSNGLIPTLTAVATTHVVNPDPDPHRNPFGSADVTIDVRGPVNNLQIDFESNPPGYSREQILALIAPFGGFVAPIAFDGAAPVGGVPGVTRTQNGNITVGQEAFNILNAQFGASLLAPLETALGQGLGFSDVNLTLNYGGNVGVSARRVLGRNVTFTYTRTFGIPSYTAFGLIYNQGGLNTAQLTFFNQTGQNRLVDRSEQIIYPGAPLTIGQPIGEGSGFSFTYQRIIR